MLFDERRYCIDKDLPKIKHPCASCDETGHRILAWHQPFVFGDTAETLDPYYQAGLEDEANYAAARLMFFGELFTEEAKNVAPAIKGLKGLPKRYRVLSNCRPATLCGAAPGRGNGADASRLR